MKHLEIPAMITEGGGLEVLPETTEEGYLKAPLGTTEEDLKA